MSKENNNKKKYREGVPFIPHGNQTQLCRDFHIGADCSNLNASMAVGQSDSRADNKKNLSEVIKHFHCYQEKKRL